MKKNKSEKVMSYVERFDEKQKGVVLRRITAAEWLPDYLCTGAEITEGHDQVSIFYGKKKVNIIGESLLKIFEDATCGKLGTVNVPAKKEDQKDGEEVLPFVKNFEIISGEKQ